VDQLVSQNRLVDLDAVRVVGDEADEPLLDVVERGRERGPGVQLKFDCIDD
jgi:hypothetical protein